MHNQRPRHAFSLVELLVVIAVVSVLISLLLPSLGKAVKLTRLNVCASNVRQIGFAVVYYASDNRQQFVPSYSSGGVRAPNGVITGADSWWWYPEWFSPYIKDRKVYICPEDNGWPAGGFMKPISDPSLQWDSNSYPMNLVGSASLVGPDPAKPRTMQTLHRPDLDICITEWGSYPGFSWHNPQPAPQYNNSKNNIVFADGHVKFVSIYWSGSGWAFQTDPPASGYEYLWADPN